MRETKHPKTGVCMNAEWIADYFGKGKYGVRFHGDDKVYDPETEEIEPCDTN